VLLREAIWPNKCVLGIVDDAGPILSNGHKVVSICSEPCSLLQAESHELVLVDRYGWALSASFRKRPLVNQWVNCYRIVRPR
jgi:hypothetical protein